MVQFVYSKSRVLTNFITIWTEKIEAEEAEIRDFQVALKHMESPFGFIQGFSVEQGKTQQRQEGTAAGKRDTSLSEELNLPPQLAKQLEALEV